MLNSHSHDRLPHLNELLQQTCELALSGKNPHEIAKKIGPIKSKIDDCVRRFDEDFCEFRDYLTDEERGEIHLLRSAISLLPERHLLVRVAAVRSVRMLLDERIASLMEIEKQISLAESGGLEFDNDPDAHIRSLN